jgi:hypothetical protein
VSSYSNLRNTSLVIAAVTDTLFHPMVTLQLAADDRTTVSALFQSDMTKNGEELLRYVDEPTTKMV